MITTHRFGPLATLLHLALVASACDELSFHLEPNPVDVPIAEVIDVGRVGCCDLAANGTDTDTIFARIPRESTMRTVKFTTNLGRFPATGGKEISETAVPGTGEWLVARVVFQADTLPGTAAITGAISDFRGVVTLRIQ